MPRLAVQRRRGEGCHWHGFDCKRGGGSSYVSDRCIPIVPGSATALGEPEVDPGVEAILVECLVRREGITADEARERRAAEAAADAAADAVEARRRARLTPAQRCALLDDEDRAFWAMLDERRAAGAKAAEDRKRADETAPAAEPVAPEPGTPGDHRAGRSGHVSARQRRPLRVAGGVYDDDDDPRVVMYAR